jgi:hypothetical protein
MEEAIIITPLDEMMEQALVKKNVTDAAISALKEKYGELKLRSVDDKEKYLEIKDAKKDCAKLRNLAVKICKEGRADAVAMQKKWVAKENEVVGKIEEVESPLDAEIDRFDANEQRIKDEEKQRQETQYMQRTQALTKMSALYVDGSFILGEFSLEGNLVKESSQSVWDEEILPKFTEQFLILEAERVEQERIKAEQAAELKKQQEELQRQQAEFLRQQEEFKKEQERIAREAEEKRRIILNKRSAQLSELGLKYNGIGYYFDDINISNTELVALQDDEFISLLDKIKPQIEQKKAEQVKKQQEEFERQKKIAEEVAAQKERARIEEEHRQSEIKRKQEEEKRVEELTKAGDKAIWADFIEKISSIQLPVVKSRQYKQMLAHAKESIDEIIALKPI